VSLSGAWYDWLPPKNPLDELKVPTLFAWGDPTNDLIELTHAVFQPFWNQVGLPKHRLVFAHGAHWDYLPANSTCEDGGGVGGTYERGPCDLGRHLAAEFQRCFRQTLGCRTGEGDRMRTSGRVVYDGQCSRSSPGARRCEHHVDSATGSGLVPAPAARILESEVERIGSS
jgi:hypothetical protein